MQRVVHVRWPPDLQIPQRGKLSGNNNDIRHTRRHYDIDSERGRQASRQRGTRYILQIRRQSSHTHRHTLCYHSLVFVFLSLPLTASFTDSFTCSPSGFSLCSPSHSLCNDEICRCRCHNIFTRLDPLGRPGCGQSLDRSESELPVVYRPRRSRFSAFANSDMPAGREAVGVDRDRVGSAKPARVCSPADDAQPCCARQQAARV